MSRLWYRRLSSILVIRAVLAMINLRLLAGGCGKEALPACHNRDRTICDGYLSADGASAIIFVMEFFLCDRRQSCVLWARGYLYKLVGMTRKTSKSKHRTQYPPPFRTVNTRTDRAIEHHDGCASMMCSREGLFAVPQRMNPIYTSAAL